MSTVDQLLENSSEQVTVENTRQWLYQYITSILEVPASEIDSSVPLHQYGLDSSANVGLIADLAEWSGQSLGAKIIKEHNTIDALSEFIGGKI